MTHCHLEAFILALRKIGQLKMHVDLLEVTPMAFKIWLPAELCLTLRETERREGGWVWEDWDIYIGSSGKRRWGINYYSSIHIARSTHKIKTSNCYTRRRGERIDLSDPTLSTASPLHHYSGTVYRAEGFCMDFLQGWRGHRIQRYWLALWRGKKQGYWFNSVSRPP